GVPFTFSEERCRMRKSSLHSQLGRNGVRHRPQLELLEERLPPGSLLTSSALEPLAVLAPWASLLADQVLTTPFVPGESSGINSSGGSVLGFDTTSDTVAINIVSRPAEETPVVQTTSDVQPDKLATFDTSLAAALVDPLSVPPLGQAPASQLKPQTHAA